MPEEFEVNPEDLIEARSGTPYAAPVDIPTLNSIEEMSNLLFLKNNSRKILERAFRFNGIFFLACVLILTAGMTSCATTRPPQVPATVTQRLPKPAPMRLAQDASMNRKPPLLPKTVVNISSNNNPSLATNDPRSNQDIRTSQTTTPKFINNEQPQDFFKGAGDAPVGETVLGSFFDSVFRPANPPNQPVSSTSYNVQ